MKKVLFLFAIISIALYSCKQDAPKDIVNGIKPVLSDSLRTSLVHLLQGAKSDSERIVIMQKNGGFLTTQLTTFLKRSGFDCRIDTIMYRYGSGKADSVASGDGKKHKGVFSNQPYAVIKGGPCFKDSLSVFILCFNGTFSLKSDAGSIGFNTELITITANNGLANYMKTIEAIAFAEKNNIPLFKGKKYSKKNEVTAVSARAILKRTSQQITALVFNGDQIDLANRLYFPVKRRS